MKIARIIRIEGRVQGVGFRDWTVEAASGLGIGGWVRNRRDGSVEALAAGNAEQIERFIAQLREGPPAARVWRVEVQPAPLQELAGFTRAATD